MCVKIFDVMTMNGRGASWEADVWWVSYGRLKSVWRVSGGCLESVWRVSGRRLEGVWKVSKRFRKTSGGCLKVSGRPVRVHVYRNGRKTRTFVSEASKPPAGARISKGPVGPLKF